VQLRNRSRGFVKQLAGELEKMRVDMMQPQSILNTSNFRVPHTHRVISKLWKNDSTGQNRIYLSPDAGNSLSSEGLIKWWAPGFGGHKVHEVVGLDPEATVLDLKMKIHSIILQHAIEELSSGIRQHESVWDVASPQISEGRLRNSKDTETHSCASNQFTDRLASKLFAGRVEEASQLIFHGRELHVPDAKLACVLNKKYVSAAGFLRERAKNNDGAHRAGEKHDFEGQHGRHGQRNQAVALFALLVLGPGQGMTDKTTALQMVTDDTEDVQWSGIFRGHPKLGYRFASLTHGVEKWSFLPSVPLNLYHLELAKMHAHRAELLIMNPNDPTEWIQTADDPRSQEFLVEYSKALRVLLHNERAHRDPSAEALSEQIKLQLAQVYKHWGKTAMARGRPNESQRFYDTATELYMGHDDSAVNWLGSLKFVWDHFASRTCSC